MAQVGAGHGSVDAVADDRRPGVQQHSLAVGSVSTVHEGIGGGEVGRADDAVGLAGHEIRPARVAMTGYADDRTRTSALAGQQGFGRGSEKAEFAHIRDVGRRESHEQAEGRRRQRPTHDQIRLPPLERRGSHRIGHNEHDRGAVVAHPLEIRGQGSLGGRRKVAREQCPDRDRSVF